MEVAARTAHNRRRARRPSEAAVGAARLATESRQVSAAGEPRSPRSGCRMMSSFDGRIPIRRTRRSTASKSRPTSMRSPRFQEGAGTKGISTGGGLQARPTTSRRPTGWRLNSTVSAWSRSAFRSSNCQRSGSQRRGKWWRLARGNPFPSKQHFRSINRSERQARCNWNRSGWEPAPGRISWHTTSKGRRCSCTASRTPAAATTRRSRAVRSGARTRREPQPCSSCSGSPATS